MFVSQVSKKKMPGFSAENLLQNKLKFVINLFKNYGRTIP